MKMFFNQNLFKADKFKLSIIILIITASCFSNAAFLRNIPQKVNQPDGTILHCYASGDEHYNWLHDKEGYTIIPDPITGFYVYAEKINGELVSSNKVAGTIDPSITGIKKWLTIDSEKIYESIKQYRKEKQKHRIKDNSETIQVSGTINNLVIFIRFSGESEFTEQISIYNNMFNAAELASMKRYFLEASYNSLNINSTYYPIPGATVLSYQDSHVRNYYKPYHLVNNPIGYSKTSDRTSREHTLLKNAVDAVKSQIPAGLNIDHDGNNFVDNVSFIIYGEPSGWSSLLWPHQWYLFSYNVTINNKTVWDYNIYIQSIVNAGVLSHEMFHTFDAPDLYHYYYDSMIPVGDWDLMEYANNPPEHMGTYMKYKYGNWIPSIPLISSPGTYQLKPITSPTNNCYRINSPNSATEYFVVEYRQKTGTFESSVPGSGLLVYRIKTDCGNGNSEGPPDEIYIYRFDGTPSANGNLSQAFFSADVARTSINDLSNPACFLSNGSEGGLILYDVGSAGNTISFKIGFGVLPPVLKFPENYSDGIITTPVLEWYRNPEALSYDLQVSTQIDFSSTIINLTGLTDTTYQILSPLSRGIRYYWRVKSHSAIDISDWSPFWDFRIILDCPILVSPLNNSHSLDTSLTISWSEAYGAETYGLQISNTVDFSNIIMEISNIEGTTYDIDGLNHNNKYYWRINSSNPGGTSPWSAAWNFSTVIGSPMMLSPFNHESSVPDSGYISWYKNPIAVSYNIQISRFPDFSVNLFDQSNVTDTFFIYHGLEFGTVYFWRLIAVSDFEVSNWSEVWDFTTILGAPKLLSPANQSLGIPLLEPFQWKSVNQAQSYNLQVSPDPAFSIDTLNLTAFPGLSTSIDGLKFNNKYYWHVSAHNSDGDGIWSDTYNFTTQLAPPLLLLPNNFSAGVPIKGSLNWEAVSGAVNYELKISKEQDFSQTIVSETDINDTLYNYNNLENNIEYYWKVATKNSGGTGEWSENWIFKTIISIPTQISPLNNAVKIKNYGKLTWQTVPGAENYNVQLSQISDFASKIIDDNSATNTSIDYLNLALETDFFWHVSASNTDGTTDWSDSWKFTTDKFSSVDNTEIDDVFHLNTYPNPVSEIATFEISIDKDSQVELTLTNLLGERIKTIFKGYLRIGINRIEWNSSEIPSGIYLVAMSNGVVIQREKIIIGR